MPVFKFTLNGAPVSVDTEGDRPLIDVLREEFGLTGTKFGCGEGQCRACTVMLDGRPSFSCVNTIRMVAGRSVVTIESLSKDGKLTPVQQAFLDEAAIQCGYCTPGMIMAATALLDRDPNPTEATITTSMNMHICRCTGYPRIVEAVKTAARLKAMAESREVNHVAAE
ncbi:MAG: (2Fe-2S)-binding protein [Bryobacteraceae bacterium]|nr:(2Fe-2S)-binding protein [Bryobacteraceae bacterium]